ncbi:putative Nucleoside phosphorylase [Paratrimastix pyriformis]|uniref:Nucleoside phosphorylase n=1 Tax=Paratrimastix pyriformis TaxID=342808 RepID=A0ABQ8UIP1_9EUKA|nr:putative Nucleoside phosphorylase [Paratrimastix pyriformis]
MEEAKKVLLSGPDEESFMRFVLPRIHSLDKSGSTLLHFAAQEGLVNGVRFMIENGFLLDDANRSFRTALHLAAMKGHKDVAAILLAGGANPDVQDQCGFTPLHLACQSNRGDVVSLLAPRCNLETAVDGQRALHMAAQFADAAVVEALVAAGAQLEAPDGAGRTPLWVAAWNGKADCVKALLDHGAVVEAPDQGGWRALHAACDQGQAASARVLLQGGARIEVPVRVRLSTSPRCPRLTPIWPSWGRAGGYPPGPRRMAGRVECLAALIQAGAALGGTAPEQQQSPAPSLPLHAAIWGGHPAAVAALLGAGADPEAPSPASGATALHVACAWGRVDIAQVILTRGARTEATDGLGRRPFDLVAPVQRPQFEALLAKTRSICHPPLTLCLIFT